MLRVVSFNANGIRAAARKGFFDWFATQDIDVLCIQETKAQASQLTDPVFSPSGYHRYFNDAEKKGYSGVAIYSRMEPDAVTCSLDFPLSDDEGRFIQAQYGDLRIISLYLPSGTSSDVRQAEKYRFMDFYHDQLHKAAQENQQLIVCGDWNIVHQERDIKNWKSNQKNSGCLPEERAWLDGVFNELGYVDAFRVRNQSAGEYTWWSNRGRARENNVGWRIDYQVVSPAIASKIADVSIYRDQFFSDHAPLLIDYEMTING